MHATGRQDEPTRRGGAETAVAAVERGTIAGIALAWAFVGVAVARDPAGAFDLFPTLGHAVAVTLRTAAIFALLGAGAGAALGGACAIARVPRLALPTVAGLGLAAALFLHWTAWWQLEVLAGVPLELAARRGAAWRQAGWSAAVGVVAAILLARVAAYIGGRGGRGGAARWRRHAARAAPVVALTAWLALDLGPLGLRRPRGSAEQPVPPTIAVIGLDGVTFRVLGPLLRAGELPAFQSLIDDGAWGTLLTYGVASSPLVWTSVATGKRARDHGITDFVTHRRAGYAPRSMRRSDWRARPIWDIFGDAQREVAVVNWLMSAPPEPVRGSIVTRLSLASRGRRAFPESLEAPVEAILARSRPYDDDPDRAETLGHVDDVFDVADLLLDGGRPGFLALYQSATDAAEHTTWRDYRPAAFDPALWPADPDASPSRATLIPDAYRRVDARLGALLARLGDDALVVVLSDHGQRAAATPRVRPRLDRVLVGLGLARTGESGNLDAARGEAYPLIETPWTPTLRINMNLHGRERRGKVAPEDYRARVDAVRAGLESVRFLDGEPVFTSVRARRRPAPPGDEADIELRLTGRARDPAATAERVRVGEYHVPLGTLVEVDRSISGDHDRRGVLFVRGPGVRRGPVGQRVLDTPLQAILRHLTDRVAWVDRWLPVLGTLGLVERASTLDISPTILLAAGLPVGRDMAGRPLTELFPDADPLTWIDTWETGDPGRRDEALDGADEDMLERLRALGYVN